MAGCGCRKNKVQKQYVTNSAANRAVYQTMDAGGNVVSEHSKPQEARKAAADIGGRVRIVSRPSEPAAKAVT